LNKSKVIVPSLIIVRNIDEPKPSNKLNSYPEKQPVIAMTPYPYLAIALFDARSPKELPHANKVKPSKTLSICVKIAIVCKQSINPSEAN